MMNREENQIFVKDKQCSKHLNKKQRDKILIDCYINWIQPNLHSEHFPILTEEEIIKDDARNVWDTNYREEFHKSGMLKKEFNRVFEKANGPRPKSLVSQEGWFLISDAKEKDVSNVHYSFGFDEGTDMTFWVEIALNSVASVEQFLSMNEKEMEEFFHLAKTKPPRMVLELTEKKKTNYASSTTHTSMFEPFPMCRLTLDFIKKVRFKANEIRLNKDPLIQPFIGICVVRFVKKEELAENFQLMEDIFNFISSLIPRKQRYRNTLREQKELEKKKEEIESQLPQLHNIATLNKNLGRFNEQEAMEKRIRELEQELIEINKALDENDELIHNIEEDMGGKIR
jgi:hypothetical protein